MPKHLRLFGELFTEKASSPLFGDRSWKRIRPNRGKFAEALLVRDPALTCDVFNLPSVGPLVTERAYNRELQGRLGFVGGDFLTEPLPGGYDIIFIHTGAHDWS